MQLLPLSAYVQGGEYAAPQGAYKEENDFVPVNKVLSMTPAEFFNTANALMQVNPPADADKELLKKLLSLIHISKCFYISLSYSKRPDLSAHRERYLKHGAGFSVIRADRPFMPVSYTHLYLLLAGSGIQHMAFAVK